MRIRFIIPVVALTAGVFAGHAQVPQAPNSKSVIHTEAHLVIVDVVVEDKQQNAVHRLKSADFQLTEDGVPQHINNFEEHSSSAAADSSRAALMPKLPPGMFTNYSPVAPNQAINILLLDALNTPEASQGFLHDQILSFVRSKPAGSPTAILGLSNSLYMLQGFTSDPQLLIAAVERKTSTRKSPLLDNSLRGNGDSNMDEIVAENSAVDSLASAAIQNMLSSLQNFEQSVEVQHTQSRASMTLNALNTIALYLSAIPGRKNLIWFSGAFPVNPIPHVSQSATPYGSALLSGSVDSSSGFSNIAGTEDEFRETTNLLARSQVAVYPIDARGVLSFGGMDAATQGTAYARNLSALPEGPGSPTYAGDQLGDFSAETGAEHGVMNAMARDTGGEAIYNTNGLGKAAAQAIRHGSDYYTITYTPTDSNWNGNFRKINVTVEGQHYSLSYRRGYYADTSSLANSKVVPSALAAGANPIGAAMTHGAPDATQILMSVRIHPSSDKADALLTREDEVDNIQAMKALGPYRHLRIDCVADARAIQAQQLPDGNYSFRAEVVVFLFDPKGRVLSHSSKAVAGNVTAENYRHLLQTGLALRQEVSVPVRGETFLRVGFHDLTSNRLGAIEVPAASTLSLPVEAEARTP